MVNYKLAEEIIAWAKIITAHGGGKIEFVPKQGWYNK